MTKIIVYHDSEGLAKRSRRGRPGETIAYRSIKQWDEDANEEFDEVLDFSTPRTAKKSKKKTGD